MLARPLIWWLVVLFAVAGCGKEELHGPEFVGTWRSGLPFSPIVDPTSAVGKRIGAGSESRFLAANASGEQGVELRIRADGSFTMRVWWSNEYLRKIAPEGHEAPDANHSTPGTWSSSDNRIQLHADKFLPYAYTRVDVTTMPRGRPLERHSQELTFLLSSDKQRMSPFQEGIPDAVKRSSLHFVRENEKP